jgi:tetratricopeptide (TPR) repeat protein
MRSLEEILEALPPEERGRIIEEQDAYSMGLLLAKEAPEEVWQEIQADLEKACRLVTEAREKKNTGDLDSAEPLLLEAKETFSTCYPWEKTSRSAPAYRNFQEPLQFWRYLKDNQSENFRIVEAPIVDCLLTLSYVLVEQQRFDEAWAELGTALHYNPYAVAARFEMNVILIQKGDLVGLLANTRHASSCSYRPEDVARCLRDFGFYYYEAEEWELAASCYALSLQWHDSELAVAEIGGIMQRWPNAPELKRVLEGAEAVVSRAGIPTRPDPIWQEVAVWAEEHQKEEDTDQEG